MIEFYGYDKCSTCRKAQKDLEARGVAFEVIDITLKPPSKKLLQQILDSGEYALGKLFNTSGVQYRELEIKKKLARMTPEQAIALLASNGRLCKRPIVTDGKRHTVGYDADTFARIWV